MGHETKRPRTDRSEVSQCFVGACCRSQSMTVLASFVPKNFREFFRAG
jgi:hypothetical protein